MTRLPLAYLNDLRTAVARANGRVTNICVDLRDDWSQGLCDPDDAALERKLGERKRWIDTAVALRAQSVRFNPGGRATADLRRPIAACKALGDYGRAKGI